MEAHLLPTRTRSTRRCIAALPSSQDPITRNRLLLRRYIPLLVMWELKLTTQARRSPRKTRAKLRLRALHVGACPERSRRLVNDFRRRRAALLLGTRPLCRRSRLAAAPLLLAIDLLPQVAN